MNVLTWIFYLLHTNTPMLKLYFFIILAMCYSLQALAQNDWIISGNFNFGLSYNFYKGVGKGKKIRYPGLKIYCGFAANGIYQKHLVVNYGPSLSIYTKSIGTNLNPLVQDIQIDFTNSAGAGVCFGADLSYYKLYRTLDNGSYYNAMLNKENAFIFSSNGQNVFIYH